MKLFTEYHIVINIHVVKQNTHFGYCHLSKFGSLSRHTAKPKFTYQYKIRIVGTYVVI